MKVCLCGLYPESFVSGSATLKVQQQLFLGLNSDDVQCDLFQSTPSKGYFAKLYEPLTSEQMNGGVILRGGVFPFLKHLREEGYDIIHFIVSRHYMMAMRPFIGGLSAKKIVTFHDTIVFPDFGGFTGGAFSLYMLKRSLASLADTMFLYNPADIEKMKRSHPEKEYRLVANGVEDDFFLAPEEIRDDTDIVAYAGGLRRSFKGYQFLKDTLVTLDCPLTFQHCGEAPADNRKEHGYLGLLPDDEYRKLLRRAAVVVVPASYESFSITALEAMASGTPVIVTKQCGVASHLTDGEGCFIIDYNDRQTLRKKLELLLTDRERRNEMSRAARREAERFRWNRVAAGHKKLYLSIAGEVS